MANIDVQTILVGISIFFWILMALGAIVCVGGFLIIRSMYKYKVSYRKVYADANTWTQTGTITLGKRRTMRVGLVKNASECRILWKFGKRIPPIPANVIMFGNEVDAYLLPDSSLVYATHDIKNDMDKITAQMNAIFPAFKSNAINELENLARRYDPRTQADKIKIMGAWVMAGIVMFALLFAGCYFGYKSFKYGVDSGGTAAVQGQNVCGGAIADQLAVKFGIKNVTVSPAASAASAANGVPFNILGIGNSQGAPQ